MTMFSQRVELGVSDLFLIDIEQGGPDGSWAIVQASNFSTLFLLSREQNPPEASIDVSRCAGEMNDTWEMLILVFRRG